MMPPGDARSTAEPIVAGLWTTERNTMTGDANAEQDKARRFHDAALPYLDDVFALARYLMPNATDAEDAVQEVICALCAILTAIAVRP